MNTFIVCTIDTDVLRWLMERQERISFFHLHANGSFTHAGPGAYLVFEKDFFDREDSAWDTT